MISQNYRDKSKDLHLLIEAVNSNAVPKHGSSPPGGGEESMKDRKSSTDFMKKKTIETVYEGKYL